MMNDLLLALAIALAAYLIGGIPFGYLIARSRGVDLFRAGSGNIGATNVARVLGRRLGVVAFVLDFAKGAVPVAVARALAPTLAVRLTGEELGVIAGLAAVLGHLFPAYLRFRGGKGVATAAGVVVVLLPVAALAGLIAWVGIVAATRIVSAGSLAAAGTLCVVRLATTPNPLDSANLTLTVFCFVAAGLVVIRHRGNIGRLLRGNENHLAEGGLMQHVSRIVHVLALGLWFGSVVFFSLIVGLCLFQGTEELTTHLDQFPWLGPSPTLRSDHPSADAAKEYGSRLGGFLISPMFGWYFLIQGVCGFLAVATAWRWQSAPERVHRLRVTLLLVALATVVAGWPLERHVHELRQVRQDRMDAYSAAVTAGSGQDAAREAFLAARQEFVQFHLASLLLNFGTLLVLTGGMALAAYLPPLQKAGAVSSAMGRDAVTEKV